MDFLAFLGQRDLGLSYSVWSQVYLLVCWSILLKIERDLRLTVFPLGTRVRQKFTYIPCLRSCHTQKNWESLDPRRPTLSGEDSTLMVDLLEIPRVIDSFF